LVAEVRSLISLLAAIAVAAAQVAPAAAAPLSKADYEACQTRDEAALRAAIEAISVRALKGGVANVDYRALVGDAWRRGGLDQIVDARVDLAVDEVRQETSWANLLQSLAYQQKAQELATAVAERVYRSDAIKAALEELAAGVGKDIGRQIEFASVDASEPTLACLKAFVGARYGMTVARAVGGETGKELSVDPGKAAAGISSGAVLRQSSEGIAGAAVLVMRRQLANMAGRVGQRIVGSVLARLVSVVAGGVGLVLVAKDIWDLRHGVLPIIAAEMKSKENKDKVQDELARSFGEQMSQHLDEIGAATADHVIGVWRDFRSAHAQALDLAERNQKFKAFLDSLRPEALPRLDEVVLLVLAAEGEAGLLSRLDDGTLNEAVNVLPAPAMEIARETRSIDAGLKWAALAGDQLPTVVELGLYRRTAPDDLSKASLRRLLALDDRLVIVRLAGVDRAARDTLFELSDADLKSLARNLTEAELATLSRYLTGLAREPRERVLRAVAENPARMQSLASERVRSAIVSSADQGAAVGMMLRTNATLDAGAILDDLDLVADGRVTPILLWEKHPLVIVAALIAAGIVLLLVRRLLFPRRRTQQPA
jgi:cell division septum initiation protein DivIVA